MRRIGVGGAVLLVLLLAGLGAAASAYAVEYELEGLPEVGHCVKVQRGAGEYEEGHCVHAVSANGYYVWHPVKEGEDPKFSGKGGATTLTVNDVYTRSLKCTSMAESGKWMGRRIANVLLSLKGCTNSESKQCQSGSTAGEVSGEITAELGLIKNTTKNGRPVVEVGLDFKQEAGLFSTPPLFTFECGGGFFEDTKIEGSLIGRITPFDVMTPKSNLLIQLVRGKQQFRKFENQPEDVPLASWMSGLETVHASALIGIAPKTESGTNDSGNLEIKAEQIG